MSLETAIDCLDRQFKNVNNYDEIEVDLFGGEPFLEFELIKEIYDWYKSEKVSIPVTFFIDTKGTLVHDHIQEWLKKNPQVIIGLSLDGTRITHNKNRSNSYDLIDTDFFLKHYPNQPVRATMYPATLNKLSEDIMHLHNMGFKVTVSPALGVDWSVVDSVNILSRELRLLIDYYIENPQIQPCSIFQSNLTRLYTKKKTKWCGTYTDMVSIDTSGKEYPCQSFQPNTTGYSLESTPDLSLIQDWSDPQCANCLIENLCSTCYGLNYLQSGNIQTRDKSMCNVRKTMVLALTYYTAKAIEKDLLHLSDQQLVLTIKAIQDIQKEYKGIGG
jgi:radical SAM protein with 4Fe4S-binding SPASM domain